MSNSFSRPFLLDKQSFFFAGVAGAGMSAIAQFLTGIGKNVSGSDRLFNTTGNEKTFNQLTDCHIKCYDQLEARIDATCEVLVVSTAIEDTNVEVAKAKALNIPIITRAQLLAQICTTKKAIAIAGTSGKSTTAAMLFHMLQTCGIDASLITGAGIVTLIQQGKIGNCYVGQSPWLIIEADESDGSLVQYKPELGVLLSIDKDHKELSELAIIFEIFKNNITGKIICNQSHPLAKAYSQNLDYDFGEGTSLSGTNFSQSGFNIYFDVAGHQVHIPTVGKHNMENALACLAVAHQVGASLVEACKALASYPGIYRRHQLLSQVNGVTVIDDYAHNPAKIEASIKACQPIAEKLIAWFQPHGYGPTRFIRKELVEQIANALRPQDEIWMSEIYYAGGTAVKDISSNDLIEDLVALDVNAFFVPDRNNLAQMMTSHLTADTVILLMGARDPGLEYFTKEFASVIATQQ
jgi:UDP-N-acetylmuramate--alanine ligase